MNEDCDKVDQILKDLDIQSGSTDPASGSGEEAETGTEETTEDRLTRLHEAGAITEEEYDVLQSYLSNDEEREDDSSADQVEFGQPLVTSEGSDMDFSVMGIFEDVDISELIYSHIDEPDSGRTLVFWQIDNHSNEVITLYNRDFEYIDQNQIAYNQNASPLTDDNLGPGWRIGEKWVDILPDTRIRYVSPPIEIPNTLSEIKIRGNQSEVHSIEITDEMYFPKSEMPVKVDV